MVKQTIIKQKIAHMCEECGMSYRNKEIAEKCEEWCSKYKSCNIELIKRAIKT